jgi:hypothetical protein
MFPTLSKLTASLVLLASATVALASLLAACSEDDTTTPVYFIGVTDASPPRLGPEDAGAE